MGSVGHWSQAVFYTLHWHTDTQGDTDAHSSAFGKEISCRSCLAFHLKVFIFSPQPWSPFIRTCAIVAQWAIVLPLYSCSPNCTAHITREEPNQWETTNPDRRRRVQVMARCLWGVSVLLLRADKKVWAEKCVFNFCFWCGTLQHDRLLTQDCFFIF